MVSRTARPRTVLLADGAPGPSAHMPEFRLAARPFGPLTSTRGAWGPVDMALLRMYIFGSARQRTAAIRRGDRKSTRLNSSHGYISYAVFCLKKKKTNPDTTYTILRT